jgi:hypothetical protein
MTVVLSSVVLVAFSATSAAAASRPKAVNPPAPTGTMTTHPSGTVTVSASGTWNWPVTGPGHLKHASTLQPCGSHFGVGWGVVWNDSNDAGYAITYKHAGVSHSVSVGSSVAIHTNTVDQAVHYNAADPCGTYDPSTGATGTWTASHTYASKAKVPAHICVVDYVLNPTPPATARQNLVNKNRNNSYHTVVKQGNAAAWATSPACFDPSALVAPPVKASPVIVTTATNATVGSSISDSAALSGTSASSTAGGSIVFQAYAPTDATCTTAIYTSSAVPVSGNGTYGPGTFTPTQGAGNYHWIATYSGDAHNNGATELCGAAGETSSLTTLSTGTGGSTTNPPTSPTGSVPVVTTSAPSSAPVPVTGAVTATTGTTGTTATTGTTTPVAISGATTVHTGEPWAGSRPFEIVLIAFGLSLMGLGFFQRRRLSLRPQVEQADGSTD